MSDPVDPIPPAFEHFIPHLTCDPCGEALEFYKKAFGAVEMSRLPGPDGKKIMHAALRIEGDVLFLADDFPEFRGGKAGPRTPAGGHVLGRSLRHRRRSVRPSLVLRHAGAAMKAASTGERISLRKRRENSLAWLGTFLDDAVFRASTMRSKCTACGKTLKVKTELAGKKVRCPHCKDVTVASAARRDNAAPRRRRRPRTAGRPGAAEGRRRPTASRSTFWPPPRVPMSSADSGRIAC